MADKTCGFVFAVSPKRQMCGFAAHSHLATIADTGQFVKTGKVL
ncbi:MAG: hypothetical protein ACI4SB_06920 [Acutalibacteraceae bacterium]